MLDSLACDGHHNPTAQVLSLTSSIFVSGVNIGASRLTIPILYTGPVSISTSIFTEFYTRGVVTLVPFCLCSTP